MRWLVVVMVLAAGCATHERPVILFDGSTLDGWHAIGGGDWTAQDGMIEGRASADESAHGLLVTDATFGDFVATFDYRIFEGDSGFYFRVEEIGDAVGVRGFQIEIDDVEPGGLYETGGRGWVIKHTPEQASEWHRSGAWNSVELVAQGPHIQVRVNGHQTAMLDDSEGRVRGHVALQLHANQDMHVQFRNIEIRPVGD